MQRVFLWIGTISISYNQSIPISYTIKTLNILTCFLLSNSINTEFFYDNNRNGKKLSQ